MKQNLILIFLLLLNCSLTWADEQGEILPPDHVFRTSEQALIITVPEAECFDLETLTCNRRPDLSMENVLNNDGLDQSEDKIKYYTAGDARLERIGPEGWLRLSIVSEGSEVPLFRDYSSARANFANSSRVAETKLAPIIKLFTDQNRFHVVISDALFDSNIGLGLPVLVLNSLLYDSVDDRFIVLADIQGLVIPRKDFDSVDGDKALEYLDGLLDQTNE